MPRIHYVGVKQDGETAYSELTGIARWMPGESHEINDPAVVKRLLQHPDVFSLKDERPVLAQPRQVPPPPPRKPTVDDLERALGAVSRGESPYKTADEAIAAFREHFGELFTADDEQELRDVLDPPKDTGNQQGENPAGTDGAGATGNDTPPGPAADQVQETTTTASVDTSGMSLAPGATIAPAPAPAPAPTPAPTAAPAAAKPSKQKRG